MDRNTITGLVLIGLILTVFSIFNRPSEEDIKKKQEEIKQKELVVKYSAKQDSLITKINDSIPAIETSSI